MFQLLLLLVLVLLELLVLALLLLLLLLVVLSLRSRPGCPQLAGCSPSLLPGPARYARTMPF